MADIQSDGDKDALRLSLWKTKRDYLRSTGDVRSLSILSWQHPNHLGRKKDSFTPNKWTASLNHGRTGRLFASDGFLKNRSSKQIHTLRGMLCKCSVHRIWGNQLAAVAVDCQLVGSSYLWKRNSSLWRWHGLSLEFWKQWNEKANFEDSHKTHY